MALFVSVSVVVLLLSPTNGLPPNYEDQDLSKDQPVGEKVDITQEDPHSNNIHVAHNNPKDRSDFFYVL